MCIWFDYRNVIIDETATRLITNLAWGRLRFEAFKHIFRTIFNCHGECSLVVNEFAFLFRNCRRNVHIWMSE